MNVSDVDCAKETRQKWPMRKRVGFHLNAIITIAIYRSPLLLLILQSLLIIETRKAP